MDSVRIVFYTKFECPRLDYFEGPGINDCRYKLGKLYVETRKEYERLVKLLADPGINQEDIRMVVVEE